MVALPKAKSIWFFTTIASASSLVISEVDLANLRG